MENNYIKIFDNELQQNHYLSVTDESSVHNPQIIINRYNKKIKFIKDSTCNKKIKYNNEKYLPFDKNNINSDFHIIPNDVDSLETIDLINNVSSIQKINNKYKKNYIQPLYKVGLISDIHYNDADDVDNNPDTFEDDGAEYSQDLRNVLEVFRDENVDFISCSGDISSDWSVHLKNYKSCVDTYFPDLSIFSCSGNHDTKPKYKYHDLWNSISAINPNNEYDIVYFKDYEQYSIKNENTGEYDNYHTDENGYGTSFYFKKYYKNTFDVYIYLNVEYGWNNRDNYNTHNCRILNQDELLVHNKVDNNNDLHLYHPQTLRCLSEILENFKEHRCFIFTHLMFPDKAGNYHIDENFGNIEYYEYASYSNHADVLRGDQGEFIRNLMEQYDNNYWFCGHSHYKWNWEKLDHRINVTKTNNSYNIHLPSLSRPLPLEIKWYETAPKDSEAAIMEVYENYVIIKGLVLKENNNNLNIIDIIYNYPDENTEYVTSDMISIIDNEYKSVEQLEDDYIQINYTYNRNISGDDNNIYLNPGEINSSNFNNYIPIIRFEDIQIWYDGYENDNISINEITNEILNEQYIGFRDNTTNKDLWNYFLKSNHIYTLYNNGLVFKISSQSNYIDYKLHFKLKFKIGFYHVGYINKFLPIACYELPSNKKENS